MGKDNFQRYGSAVVITNPTSVSSNVALSIPTGWGNGPYDVEVCNTTIEDVFVAFGSSTVTASSTSETVFAKSTVVLRTPNRNATYAAAATGSGTAAGNIKFTVGRGQ